MRFVERLFRGQPDEAREPALRRLAAVLTHQAVEVHGVYYPISKSISIYLLKKTRPQNPVEYAQEMITLRESRKKTLIIKMRVWTVAFLYRSRDRLGEIFSDDAISGENRSFGRASYLRFE